MHQQKLVPPFANSDSEIAEVEGFAVRQGLDQIARICGELRSARQEVLDLRGLNESYAKSLGLPRVVRISYDPHRMETAPVQLELDLQGGGNATKVG